MEIKILESQVLDLVERARAGDRDAFGRLLAAIDASPSHAARQEERFDRLEAAFQGLGR